MVIGGEVDPRDELSWFETRPLFGRRLLVTRSREQAASLQLPLEALGAEVSLLRTLEIGPPDDWAPVDAAIGRLHRFQWVVFTSTNAVTFFFDRLRVLGKDARAFSPARIASVGWATAEALRQRGVEPDLIPEEPTQEGLIGAFEARNVKGAEVLVPASAIGRTLLDDRLTERDAAVTRVVAYENRAPDPATVEIPASLTEDRLDMLVFASPSSVRHFIQVLGEERALDQLRRKDLASIGPTTSGALAELDLAVAVQPEESTVPALVEAIRAHYAGQTKGGVSRRTFRAGKLPHEVLERLIGRYTRPDPRLVVPPGLGEDAAVIDFGDRYLVAKTDPITFATDAIGWYAIHVNANDIASMGAVPRFFLATIIVPEDQASEALVESIFRSIHEAAAELDITVCGGHTEFTHGIDRPIVVGQMLGEVERDRLVRSSGLVPGDSILLTKGMAIEATAIIAREKRHELLGRGYDVAFLDRCAEYLTDPGISVVADARLATGAGQVHAMHDPTEGGAATGLMEIALASGVGLEVLEEGLYISPDSARLCTEYGLDPFGVISSGALLIGCPAGDETAIARALRGAGIDAHRIAEVRGPDFGLQLRRCDHTLVPLPRFEVDEITRLFQAGLFQADLFQD